MSTSERYRRLARTDQTALPKTELTCRDGLFSFQVHINGNTICTQLPKLPGHKRIELVATLEKVFSDQEFSDVEAASKVIDQHIKDAEKPEQKAAPISAGLASLKSLLRSRVLKMFL